MIAKAVEASSFNLLLVEDHLVQARLVEAAFATTAIVGRVHWVKDGVDALAFMRQMDYYRHKPIPDIVLLDIHMPRKNGWDVLQEAKADTTLCSIPIVMFSTACERHNVQRAYECGANMFVPKPEDVPRLREVLIALYKFWSEVCLLPNAVSKAPAA